MNAVDREARSAAVTDREARSAAVTDREARSAAVIAHSYRQAARDHVLPALVPQRLVFFRGAPEGRRVALTFDDGPDEMTLHYLDLLDQLGVRGSFFLIGRNIAERPHLLPEYLRRGHEVAAHGYTHTTFPTLSAPELEGELARTAVLLPPPPPGPALLRPPRGAISAGVLLRCLALGYSTALWSLDSLDHRLHDGQAVLAHVAHRSIHSGEILLLHEGQRWTLDALPGLVRLLRDQGFDLVTVSELLAGGPY